MVIVSHKRLALVIGWFLPLFLLGCVSRNASVEVVFPRQKALDFTAVNEEWRNRDIQEAKSVAVEFPAPWTEKKISVLRSSGVPLSVTASRTVAKVRQDGEAKDWPLIAFVCPDTGNTWIGPEYPCYIETSAGLYGLKVPVMFYTVNWFECGVVKQYDYKLPLFDDLLDRFQKEAAYFYVTRDRSSLIYDCSFSYADFFILMPDDCVQITEATFSQGILRLVATNTCVRSSLDVTIDTNAHEITRSIQSGKQVFPEIR